MVSTYYRVILKDGGNFFMLADGFVTEWEAYAFAANNFTYELIRADSCEFEIVKYHVWKKD